MAQGIDLNNLDETVSPRDDFYHYANGNWLKNHPIPNDEYRWGTFNELKQRNENLLHEILEELSGRTDLEVGTNVQKLRDFYLTGINEQERDRQGLAPIQAELDRIRGITNTEELLDAVPHLQRIGVQVLWWPNVEPDDKNSTVNILRFYQGGLGLPDRDYYLKTDEASLKTLEQYRHHLAAVFELLGNDPSTSLAKAKTVLDMETELAKASMTNVERRDPVLRYNKMTIGGINTLAGNIDWPIYMQKIGAGETKELIVSQPKFMEAVNGMWQSVAIADWQTYLEWKLLSHTSDKLDKRLQDLHFSFYGKVLTGAKELKPAWRRALELIDECLGEALGQEYVLKSFSPEAKQKVNAMVEHLITAFAGRIKALEWMGEETKQRALEKLSKFGRQIGFPDKWRDYSALEIKPDAYVLNYFRAFEFEFNRTMGWTNKPVDKGEWFTTPPTVNAYNAWSLNQIVFPAGILQPPFFDPNADDALNYGAIGMVIGHELTHGFDDEGGQYDGDGNLKEWWTEEDKQKFKDKAARMAEQFSSYKVGDLSVNGELTLGENIADLGGLYIAFEAYQQSHANNARPADIDGFTPEQRFFLSYAQIWRQNMHDEARRKQILTDPHSPGHLRVNGPLSNMPEFHQAFGVKEGDVMYRPPELRPKIW